MKLLTRPSRDDQPQSQRNAIKRLLSRPGVRHENIPNKIGISDARLNDWFQGGRALSQEQFERLRAIAVPPEGLKRAARESQADAAYHRILRRFDEQPNSPAVSRVLQVLELLRKAEEMRLELYPIVREELDHYSYENYDPFSEKFSEPQLHEVNLQLTEVMKQLDGCLERYTWSPVVVCHGDFIGLSENYTWSKTSEIENWENWAVFWLIRHAVKNSFGNCPSLILRFRHCRQCKKWFYALTEHQKQCSTVCRKKFHSQSPEFKQKRAKYMRERYRPGEKERAANAKAGSRKSIAQRRKGEA